MQFCKVMLARDADLDRIMYPVYASPKYDGVRCHIEEDENGIVHALTRSNKPIPNKYIRAQLERREFRGFDCELIVGEPTAQDVFQKTQSAVMSFEGEPEFTLYVHDYLDMDQTFEERLSFLMQLRHKVRSELLLKDVFRNVVFVDHRLIESYDALLIAEHLALDQGYEGLILRNPSAKYKQGRAGKTGQELLRLKRFNDAEAVIIGWEQRFHNANDAMLDERGYTKRSTRKDGMVAENLLGSFRVRDPETGVEFNIGSGFNAAQRFEFWNRKEELLGKLVSYKYFEVGVKDAPRFPIFKGFRDAVDM